MIFSLNNFQYRVSLYFENFRFFLCLILTYSTILLHSSQESLSSQGSYPEWQVVMSLLGGVNILGAVLFGIFGSASIQPWAKVHRKSMPEIVSSLRDHGQTLSQRTWSTPPITPISAVPGSGMTKDNPFDFSLDVEANTSRTRNGLVNGSGPEEDPDKFFGGIHLKHFVSDAAGNVTRIRGMNGTEAAVGTDNDAFTNEEDNTNGSENSDDGEEEESVSEKGDENGTDTNNRQLQAHNGSELSRNLVLEVTRLPLFLQNITQSKKDGGDSTNPERKRKTGVVERPIDLSGKTEHRRGWKKWQQVTFLSQGALEREKLSRPLSDDPEKTEQTEAVVGQDFSTNGTFETEKRGMQNEISDDDTGQYISIRL